MGDKEREDLVMLINHHARLTIEDWWNKYQMPLHNQNLKRIEELHSALERFKGAYWALGLVSAGIVIVVNHFWK